MIGEATEEGLDELYQGYVEQFTWNPEKTHEEILHGGLTAALVGGFLGGGMSGLSVAGLKQQMDQELATRTVAEGVARARASKIPNAPETTAALRGAWVSKQQGVSTDAAPQSTDSARATVAQVSADAKSTIEGCFLRQLASLHSQ